MTALYEDDPRIVTIKPGSIITYLLAPKDKPVNPLKVWRGKVKLCDRFEPLNGCDTISIANVTVVQSDAIR